LKKLWPDPYLVTVLHERQQEQEPHRIPTSLANVENKLLYGITSNSTRGNTPKHHLLCTEGRSPLPRRLRPSRPPDRRGREAGDVNGALEITKRRERRGKGEEKSLMQFNNFLFEILVRW
jgi:hypothetical protein